MLELEPEDSTHQTHRANRRSQSQSIGRVELDTVEGDVPGRVEPQHVQLWGCDVLGR